MTTTPANLRKPRKRLSKPVNEATPLGTTSANVRKGRRPKTTSAPPGAGALALGGVIRDAADGLRAQHRTRTLAAVTAEHEPTLDDLATAVKQEVAAARQQFLEHVRNAGVLLLQAHKRVPHGEWENWLRQHCEVSERTARAYIQVAEGWDELEAIMKRQRVADLPLRRALALLAAPKEQAPPPDVDSEPPERGETPVVDTPREAESAPSPVEVHEPETVPVPDDDLPPEPAPLAEPPPAVPTPIHVSSAADELLVRLEQTDGICYARFEHATGAFEIRNLRAFRRALNAMQQINHRWPEAERRQKLAS